MTYDLDAALSALLPPDPPCLILTYRHGDSSAQGPHTITLGAPLAHHSTFGEEGIFARWHWDGDCLTVKNDRLGFYPLYYAHEDNRFIISPSIPKILTHLRQRDLNKPALAVFLRLWYYLGTDTPFEAIHALPPNATLRWQQGSLTVETAPYFSHVTAPTMRYDDAIDRYIALFQAAIQKQLPGQRSFTVPLSGGRDSRHILLELHRLGLTPATIPTLDYAPPTLHSNARTAEALAHALGLACERIPPPASFITAIQQDIALSYGCNGANSWAPALTAALQQLGVEISYDGLAGDALTSLPFRQIDPHQRATHTHSGITHILYEDDATEHRLRRELSADMYHQLPRTLAKARLLEEFALFSAEEHPYPWSSFVLMNRTRRYIALIPLNLQAAIPTVYCPYLDHDLLDFAWQLPLHFLTERDFRETAITHAYPRYADIPYANEKRSAPFDRQARAYYRHMLPDFLKILLRAMYDGQSSINYRYLFTRSMIDVVRGPQCAPWYLSLPLYMNYLHRLQHHD